MFYRIFIFVSEYTDGGPVFSRASKVIFKSPYFLCHFTGVSRPTLRSGYIFPAVSVSSEAESHCSFLSVCQFN